MRDLIDELASGARMGRFISVGLVGSVVDLSVSTALTLGAVLPPEFAKLVGAELAIVVMFYINDRWTFAEVGKPGRWSTLRRLVRSNVVRAGGLAVQVAIVYYLTRLDVTVTAGGRDIWPVLTMPIAIACAFIVNYTAESLFTWKVTEN